MSAWIAALPIRSKIMLLASLVSVVALLISGGINAFTQYRSGKDALTRRLQTHGDVAALNCSAAVAFDDADAASRVLDSMRADSAIVSARITTQSGAVLATRQLVDGAASDVTVSADVVVQGKRIGGVQIWASSEELRTALRRNIFTLFVVFCGALAASLIAASRLQHIISKPILALERVASGVAQTRDYSVRVAASGNDEVGRLVNSFNDMLGQLDARAREASEHRSELESKVAARTAELAAALQHAEAAARAKAEFLANMSHEIRTPMNGVIGMLDLMETVELQSEARSMLNVAQNSANSLLVLINDVLDFSKIDAGKLILENADVQLRSIAEDVATLFAQQANAKGVEVTCAVHNNVPAIVGGDPTRLRQIMANLVGNAVKFTSSGGVMLGVQARELAATDGDLAPPLGASSVIFQILVQDNGIGMSAAAKAQLFQAFTQADGSTTRVYGGTGLGLAIAKSLVDAMRGTIRVKSDPGQGSTFSIFIPLERRAALPPEIIPASTIKNALIVDDNPTNRCILEHYLQYQNVAYESASSARQGLQAVRAAASAGMRFDVVLLDYQMPEMDGVAFLRELRADAAIAGTPCIVLSSLGGRVAEAQPLGVAAWLTKPVRRAQLRQCLLELTSREPQELSTSRAPRAAAAHSGNRVLLVEDNDVNTMVALRVLKNLGIAAVAVGNGQEALSTVQREVFDLVLMDCQMPVMDGYAATSAIRAWEDEERVHGRNRRLPIVAMTAHAMPGDREKCLAAGMDDYLTKPIKADAVAKIIKAWFASAASERAGVNAAVL